MLENRVSITLGVWNILGPDLYWCVFPTRVYSLALPEEDERTQSHYLPGKRARRQGAGVAKTLCEASIEATDVVTPRSQ